MKWKKWSRRFFHFSFDIPTFAGNWKYNPQKRKSDYEKNDAITGLLRYADCRDGRLDLRLGTVLWYPTLILPESWLSDYLVQRLFGTERNQRQ